MRVFRVDLCVASLLGVVLTTATMVLLQAQDAEAEPTVITACVQSPTGIVRIVQAPADCRASETVLQWNQQGPAGPSELLE